MATPMLFLAGVLTLLLLILWKREARSMFNAGVFGMAVVFTYVGLMEIAFQNDWAVGIYAWLTLGLFVGLPLLFVVGSLVLILNGRTMAEREGISLAHMLAPVVGAFPLLIVAALVGVALIALTGSDQASSIVLAAIAIVCVVYGYMLWTAFCTIGYGALYTAIPKTRDPDVIIVHGAGLIDGRVSPLLASRLDKAVNIYHAGGDRAILIPSGGQGDDEPVSEACAMADYLLAHGVSAEHIVPEDQSRTTEENMRFSKESIARRGIGNPTAVFVTSSYHVFRTALIARRVGLEGEGVGSKTAHYYLPSAIIREFVAIAVLYKWWHIIPAVLLVDLLIIGVVVR